MSKPESNVLEIPGGKVEYLAGGCYALWVDLPGDRYLLVSSVEGDQPPRAGDEFVRYELCLKSEGTPLEMNDAILTTELLARLAEWTKAG